MSRNVLILGAGVVGLCTALECARRGHAVTVIDRKPRRRDGCSFGNAGWSCRATSSRSPRRAWSRWV